MTPNPCPKCGSELEMGYGLAGGGIGPYTFCECGYMEKFHDPQMEEPDDARAIHKDAGQVQDRGPDSEAGQTEGGENLQRDAPSGRGPSDPQGGDGAAAIRKAAKEVGYSDDDVDAFDRAMEMVKGVSDGTIAKPGGPSCRFPHCSCNSPWTLCEKDPRP